MKKTFFKNLLRDIKKSLSRFISIVVIIAVGVAFYAGVRAASPDMKMSGDTYFSKNNFMDYKLISTLGLTENDLTEVRKISGITMAEGAYSIDAVTEIDKHQLVLNINSMPEENGINNIRLVQGKRPQKADEAVVEERFLEKNKLKLNDKLVLTSGNDSNLEDDLKNIEFTIVGTAQSPLYVSAQRQLSSVGNGSVSGFVYILPQVFKSEVYTEIYVRTHSAQSEKSLLDYESYKSAEDRAEKALKDIGISRNEARYTEVMKSATDKLDDAQTKLDSSQKEAQDKFAQGYKELDTAKNKISDGWDELKKNENLYNQKMSEGQKQLDDGKRQLEEGKKQLDDSENMLNSGKKQAADNISNSMSQELGRLKALMEANPGNTEYANQYFFLNQVYEKDIKGKDFDSIYNALKSDNMLENMKTYFDMQALKNTFDKSAADINSGRQQLTDKEKELNSGEAQLQKSKQEGLAKLSSARKELQDGEKEVNDNTEKLKSEEEKANAKIKDGEAEIQKNREKLKDIKKPDWYVLGRSANMGFETYRQDGDRIDSIGKAFPFIFFLVAALVSLTTMTRMVQEKRMEIGTFAALGYSRAAIVAHYLIYALSASIIGSLIGISIGFRLFPPIIMNAYGTLYAIPDTVAPFNSMLALQASLLAILFTSAAAIASTMDGLREVPASLMRPKPPKSGKRILLERANFIWKRLSFTEKVTARNIFRYKQRLFMTVIGIAACTGLMITGFGIKEGITGATETQFSKLYRYDMQGTLTKNVSEADMKDMKEKTKEISNIKGILFTYSKNGTVKMNSASNHDAYIIVPEDKTAFTDYINLTLKNKEFKLDDEGVVLTEKLSKLINKKPGDTIEITLDDQVVKAKVAAVTEHYVQHYVYMSAAYYEKLTGKAINFNSFYALLKDLSEEAQNNTSGSLKNIDGINSIGYKNNVQLDFNKTIDSISSVVLVLIISAGVLAFVVIYNLTNINITERMRELATIKLLGFYDHELAAYIYRENMLLTVLGSLFGMLTGILMNKFVLTAAEIDTLKFLERISPLSFIISVVLTIVFSVVVNLAMYKRFDKIDMIESLKSAE